MSENQNNAQVLPSENTVPAQAVNIVSRGNAWRRFFARIFDLYLFSFIAMPILILLTGNAEYFANVPTVIYSFCALIAWTLIEPIFMSMFGTTLGKLLLGIHISDQNNQKLSIRAALKRSFSVWFYGFGLGIPLVNLFTFITAYSDLTKRGFTRWDRVGKIQVSYARLSAFKIAVFLIVLAAMFVF